MRVPLAETRDTFDYRNLPPPEILDRCGLDYRTSPPQADPGRITAFRAGLWYLVILVVAVPLLVFLSAFTLSMLVVLGVPAALYLAASGVWGFLQAQPAKPGLFGGLACIGVLLYIAIVKLAPFAEAAYIAGFVPALLAAVLFTDTVTLQVARWITANMRLEWETRARWEGYWRRIHSRGALPVECPEVAQARAARPALAAAILGGGIALVVALASPAIPWAGMIATSAVALIIPVAWVVSHLVTGTPFPPPFLTMRTTAWAIAVWWSYNRHEARAPGVFQFPTAWCRSRQRRDFALGFALAAIALALVPLTPVAARGVYEPPPWSSIEWLAASPLGLRLAEAWNERAHMIREAEAADPPGPFSLPAACLFAAVGSPVLLFLIVWLRHGSVLTRFYLALEVEGAPGQSTRLGPWDNAVDRLLNPVARDGEAARHILLGRNYYFDYPVLLDRRILDEHAHITGGSGGGKTSLGVAPLLSQLIASEDCSVVVLDLKGDRALMRTAEIEARRSGADFKWFTNRREVSSFVFNPFQQSHVPRLTPNQRTQAVLQGLSLDYGEAYGKSFFTAMNEATLLRVLRRRMIGSFDELSDYLALLDEKESRHLAALVARLDEVHPLNATQKELVETPEAWNARIDAPGILRDRQVVYFYLSSPEESLSAPAIAKLLVYCLFTAAAHRQPGENKQVYLFIDEFQRVTSQSVKLVLEQGRSLGLSFIVVHQTSEQLAVGDRALLQVVDECTAFKQVFRAQDEHEVKRLMDRSGMAVYHTLSWQQEYDARAARDEDWFRPGLSREGIVLVGETAGPRLDRNTISELSSAPLASFVSFGVNRGFTQYGGYVTPVLCEYSISEHEYTERSRVEWPADPARTVMVPPASTLNPTEKPSDRRQSVGPDDGGGETDGSDGTLDDSFRDLLADHDAM